MVTPRQADAGGSPPTLHERRRRRAMVLAAGAALALFALVVVGYLFRGPIGARLLVAYLRSQGVPAQIDVDRLGPSGFSGSLVIGPPSDPDLSVERMEVEFAPGPWSGRLYPQIRSVRLVQPRLRLRYDGRRLSFGTLQPLVDQLGARRTAAPAPEIQIEGGLVELITPAGEVQATGDAAVAHGRLQALSARILPARLAYRGFRASLVGGQADVWGHDRLRGAIGLKLDEAAWGGEKVRGLVAGLGLDASRAAAGAGLQAPFSVAVTARAATADGAAASAREPRLDATLRAKLFGPWSNLRAAGDAQVRLAAASAATANARLEGAGADLNVVRLDLRLGRAPTVELSAAGQVAADRLGLRLGRGHLAMRAVRWRGTGDLGLGGKTPSGSFRGDLEARGGADRRAVAQLVRRLPAGEGGASLRAAAESLLTGGVVSVKDVEVTQGGRGLRAVVHGPASISGSEGRSILASPRPGAPLLAMRSSQASGAFELRSGGPGLPRLTAIVSRYRAAAGPGGWSGVADLAIDAAYSDPHLRDARLAAAGRLVARAGGISFVAARCARLSVGAVSNAGRPLLQPAGAELCPIAGRPMLGLDRRGWRLSADAKGVELQAPQLHVAVRGGVAEVEIASAGQAGLKGQVSIRQAVLADTSPDPLFRPLRAQGPISIARGVADGVLQMAEDARGRAIAEAAVHQDLGSGAGEARISAPALRFDPQGLQLAQVFPVASGLATDASGEAAFEGWARWGRSGLTSGGELKVASLDFRSPLGRVRGLATDVRFDSLLPLTTPPGQHAAARSLQSFTSLSNPEADFALSPTALEIQAARAGAAGGKLAVGPMVVPFAGDHATSGVLAFRNIDIGAMLEASSFADRISAQARLDGQVRFAASDAGFHILSGRADATGPGRLSIRRVALTGVVAEGAAAKAAPSPMQDLAYQALENLAFTKLDAVIEPRPGGRLGMVFHITGRHDPPKAPKATVSLFDILRGKAFQKQIPLPKGTPINLTLDTSINFDELMHDYLAATSHGSAPVQP